jgi:hypothetical protein
VTVDYDLSVVNNLPDQATLDANVAEARANAANYYSTGDPKAIDDTNVQITDKLALTGFSVADVSNLRAAGDLTVNTNFDGVGDVNLLTGTDILPAGAKESLSFRVTYTPDYPNARWDECDLGLTNQAEVNAIADAVKVSDLSDNGTNPSPAEVNEPGTGTDDPTPVVFSRRCRVGLAKDITAGPTSNGDGSYDLEYTFNVVNQSQTPVTNPVIDDDLEATFGTAFVNANVSADDTCTGATLPPGGTCRQVLDVTIEPVDSLGPWDNSATLTVTGPGGQRLTDVSQDGTDPDPDKDGDPTNNSDPTPLELTPEIGLAKRVTSGPTKNADGTYNIDYTFVVENTGGAYLTNPVIDDDLSRTFGTGLVDQKVTSDACTGVGLDLGATCQVVISVKVDVPPGQYNNSATVVADAPGGKVNDTSQDGVDADPDGDGDPTNNGRPTPVTIPGTNPTTTTVPGATTTTAAPTTTTQALHDNRGANDNRSANDHGCADHYRRAGFHHDNQSAHHHNQSPDNHHDRRAGNDHVNQSTDHHNQSANDHHDRRAGNDHVNQGAGDHDHHQSACHDNDDEGPGDFHHGTVDQHLIAPDHDHCGTGQETPNRGSQGRLRPDEPAQRSLRTEVLDHGDKHRRPTAQRRHVDRQSGRHLRLRPPCRH